MASIRDERAIYARMIRNARLDDIDYKDWPQYELFLKLTYEWYVLREVTEILEHIIDPSLEQKDKEIAETVGIQFEICLKRRPQQYC